MTHKLSDNTYEKTNLRILSLLVVFAVLSLLYVVSFLVFETSQVNMGKFGPQVVAAQKFLQQRSDRNHRGDIADSVFDYVARVTSGNNAYVNSLSNGQLSNGFSNVITRPVVTTMEYGMANGAKPPTNIMDDWTDNVYGMASSIANMTNQVKQQGGVKTLIGTKGVPSYYKSTQGGVDNNPKYIRGVAKQALSGTELGDVVVNGTSNSVNLVNKALPTVRNATQLSSKFAYESMLGLKTAHDEYSRHITPIIEARRGGSLKAEKVAEPGDVEGEVAPVRDIEELQSGRPKSRKRRSRKVQREREETPSDLPNSEDYVENRISENRKSGYAPGSVEDLMFQNMIYYLDQGGGGGAKNDDVGDERGVTLMEPTRLPQTTKESRDRPARETINRDSRKPPDYSKLDYPGGTVVIDPTNMEDRSKMFPAINRVNEDKRNRYRQLEGVDMAVNRRATYSYLQNLLSLRAVGNRRNRPKSTEDVPADASAIVGLRANVQNVLWKGAQSVGHGSEPTGTPSVTNDAPTTTDTTVNTNTDSLTPNYTGTLTKENSVGASNVSQESSDIGRVAVDVEAIPSPAMAAEHTDSPIIVPEFIKQPALSEQTGDGVIYILPEDVYADRIAETLRKETLETANTRINITDIYRALAAGSIDEPAAYSGLVALLTKDLNDNMYRLTTTAIAVMEFVRSVYTTRASLATFLGPQMGDRLLHEVFRSAVGLSNMVSQQEEEANVPVNTFFPIGDELLNDYQSIIDEFVDKINSS